MIEMPDIASSARGLARLDRPSALEALARHLDAQGGLTYVVALDGSRLWVSSAWERRFGGTNSQFAQDPRTLVRYVHPEDLPRLGAFVAELSSEVAAVRERALAAAEGGSGATSVVELRLRTISGAYEWFEVRSSAVLTHDASSYVVGTVADVSAIHEANDQLVARTVAEIEANRATAAFVSKMSHELRTPLHAILGYAQLLEMGAGDPADYLARLRRAGDHLVQLLDDLLDYSRLNASRLTVSDEAAALGDLVDGALEIVASLATTHQVSLTLADDAAHVVRGDPTRIRQVLVNLLANAIKYNRPGGSVVVRTAVHDAWYIRIEVEDDGPGIAPELLDRLFRPFERIGAESSNVPGAGLGLALSRGLVRSMTGDIDVRSVPGQGSCFTVRLLRADAAVPSEPRHVVCIDDDPDSRRILETLTGQLPDAVVHLAGSAADGLLVLSQVRPSLVVLDRHLPGQDPARYLEAVGRVAPGCPVVAISSDPEVLGHDAVQSPVVAAFTKPLDLEMFADALARAWAMRPA